MSPASPRRIVVTGPESTGKSAIAQRLARDLGLPMAPEYARVYLETHGPRYDYDLLLRLSRGHLDFQRHHVDPAAALGIFDTDLINYKVWCEVAYGACHPDILAAMAGETGHRYLLCAPDLPWEWDPLREHPGDRPMLFERHRAEIERLGRPYRVVTGQGEDRFRRAAAAVTELLAG